MKYLVFCEINWKDIERVSVLREQVFAEREKGSDLWPKSDQMLFDGHILQSELYKKSRDIQNFWIFETDNQMHLINYRTHYAPYMDIKFIPITETRIGAQSWFKMKR